jgi:hypothetical protein
VVVVLVAQQLLGCPVVLVVVVLEAAVAAATLPVKVNQVDMDLQVGVILWAAVVVAILQPVTPAVLDMVEQDTPFLLDFKQTQLLVLVILSYHQAAALVKKLELLELQVELVLVTAVIQHLLQREMLVLMVLAAVAVVTTVLAVMVKTVLLLLDILLQLDLVELQAGLLVHIQTVIYIMSLHHLAHLQLLNLTTE